MIKYPAILLLLLSVMAGAAQFNPASARPGYCVSALYANRPECQTTALQPSGPTSRPSYCSASIYAHRPECSPSPISVQPAPVSQRPSYCAHAIYANRPECQSAPTTPPQPRPVPAQPTTPARPGYCISALYASRPECRVTPAPAPSISVSPAPSVPNTKPGYCVSPVYASRPECQTAPNPAPAVTQPPTLTPIISISPEASTHTTSTGVPGITITPIEGGAITLTPNTNTRPQYCDQSAYASRPECAIVFEFK